MEFIKGADLSMFPELEQAGAVYYDHGKQKDLLRILGVYGINAVRLRLWNNPYDENGRPYGGGTNDFARTAAMAKRIRAAGMQFFLDIHYSDFWTDPAKQRKPKAWEKLSGTQLASAVYNYTAQVLLKLREQGVPPDMIQIGNELTNGFLWPDGRLADGQQNFHAMCQLLKAGLTAAREDNPARPIVLHLDNGGNHALYRGWFDHAKEEALDFDIIGLSYYPYWHGTLADLKANIDDISARYGKDILIMETSLGFTDKKTDAAGIFNEELAKATPYGASPQGQADFLRDLIQVIRHVPNGRGKGFFYWEPAWLPLPGVTWTTKAGKAYIHDTTPEGNSWSSQALFDFAGNALPALEAVKKA
ncbi:MAG: glycosyl hydrolase 53 family protein [Oscillospiraceae bacterium]|jgi:arabinogalactan endo-1,4-beta-galactosidase|nr:glycosyl hydrolase 53 family protein [Oscillospiraceae bacterium]